MYHYIVTADIIILISGSLGHFHSRDHYMCHPHQVKKIPPSDICLLDRILEHGEASYLAHDEKFQNSEFFIPSSIQGTKVKSNH